MHTEFLIMDLLFFIALFCSMLVFVYIGRRISIHQAAKTPGRTIPKNKIVEGAIFALMGLLIAFTFSGARDRFEMRRTLVIEEANAIKTAYLRLDLLPDAVRANVQGYVKQYLTVRLAIYKKFPRINKTIAEMQQSEILQMQIWDASVQACKQESISAAACIVLLPAINEMIDVANTRFESIRMHPPVIVLLTLIILALFSAGLTGYNISNKSNWPKLHIFLFAIIISFTIFIIINLEYPHVGLIPVSYFDRVLVDVGKTL